jgi:pyruvate dehydrogenase E2 component (dihydrolipoamide acetyltransferase)
MPKLGMTMTEGRVVEWPQPLGARVEKGAVVLVIESEKSEVEIESPASGFLRHVYVEPDRTVPCGTLLAALTATLDEPFDADAFRRDHDRPERVAPKPAAARPERTPVAAASPRAGAPVTPAARALAKQHGIDPSTIVGSGPDGRVLREDVEALLTARERLVSAGGGVSLEVMRQGRGQPLVLVPGFGCDVSMFAPIVPALAEAHRVIGVNPRGIGMSDAPDAPVYVLDTVAREVLAVSGTDSVHVVGASLGAAVAIEMALAAPERVRSLTLITPFLEIGSRLDAVLEAWCQVGVETTPATLAAMLLPWLVSAEHLADERARRRSLRGLAEMVARVPAVSLARYAAGLRAWSGSRRDRLGGLAAKTLVLAGSEDLLTPDARDVADAIPNARFVAVGGAGHALSLEAPDVVSSAVLEHR